VIVGKLKDTVCYDSAPFDVTNSLIDQVKEYATWSPRSQQTMVGASEIGTPCARRLAYKLLDVEAVNTDMDSWPAIVGTSVHAYLERAFKKNPDYMTEVKVMLEPWTKGTADLVHLPSKTVIDHKVVGVTALKKYKSEGMSQQYRVQLNMYALGLRLMDIEIENIAIMFWSRSGMMRDAFSITEPYDESLVDEMLKRFDAIKEMTTLGVTSLPLIPTTPTYCMYCPNYLPLSTDVTAACNGQ
jgi:CRISPR/Cas system-associated exonuclease Cas4 (RecB family)